MVYEKYIKRGNKLCGPYYYESYRSKDGKVKKRYLGKVKEKKTKLLSPEKFNILLAVVFGFIILMFIFFQANQNFTGLVISENESSGEIVDEVLDKSVNENVDSEFDVVTKQYSAIIGRPVKWVKVIEISGVGELNVEIPKEAEEVVLKTGDDVQESLDNIEDHKIILDTANRKDILEGKNFEELELANKGIFQRFWSWFKGLFKFTGKVVEDIEEFVEREDFKEVDLSDVDESEIVLEYVTEAPKAIEEELDNGKRIVISGPDEVHYENVLAYSEIFSMLKEDIKFYHFVDGIKEEMEFDAYDLDGDGFVDYIEWIVPSLSEQVYEIIYITDAMHLDVNKNFISDITSEVNNKDGVWSEVIGDGEYVRVGFERALNKINDITIYARGFGDVEVYGKDSDEMIALFENIGSENYYKIYLTNLGEESYEVFDLKVLGEIEFDYIVDPACGASISGCCDITSSGTYTLPRDLILGSRAKHICINIFSDDVIFDLGGYGIFLENRGGAHFNTTSETAINVTGDNVVVRNGKIVNFVKGIFIDGGNSGSYENLNITTFGKYCIPGDANCDGIVNAFDLAKLRQGNPDADFNNDGFVNAFDLAKLRQGSGKKGGIPVYGIYSSRGLNNKLSNSSLSFENIAIPNLFGEMPEYDSYFDSSLGNVFLNVSYGKGDEHVSLGSELRREWYYQAYVSDSNGEGVEGAQVSASDVFNVLQFDIITDVNGYTPIWQILDYVNEGVERVYHSPYNLVASKEGYSLDSHEYDVTLEQSNLEDSFNLEGVGGFNGEWSLSPMLEDEIQWNIENFENDVPAIGNNEDGVTDYWVRVNVLSGEVDLYMKADGDLISGGDAINLENEKYNIHGVDESVPGIDRYSLTDSYNLVAENLGVGEHIIYLKFYLDIPSSEAPGTYTNEVSFKLEI